MSSERKTQPVLEVLTPGPLNSIQDRGRFGYQRLGIAEAGAMDALSFVAANRLVGNGDNEAALEITIMGPTLRFLKETVFSLTGADLSTALDGESLGIGGRYNAQAGQILTFGPRKRGCRAYLAVQGGFEAPRVLGSRSTYLYAGFGGLQGRALAKGDILARYVPITPRPDSPHRLPEPFLLPDDGPRTLRVIMGPNEDRFTEKGIKTFLESAYHVTPESNRMGYRLEGPEIEHAKGPIIVSESTPLGAIQVPGQGKPLVLLHERGTTGGYTKIACIITADIDVIAQAPFGQALRFKTVRVSEAHDAEAKRRQALEAWRE